MSVEVERRPALVKEFLFFATIGAFGYLVDVGVLSLALLCGLGFYFGRVVSFLSAATFTWYGNRKLTFVSPADGTGVGAAGQLVQFICWNALGGAVNFGVYAVLIREGGVFVRMPFLAVAGGSLAGLAINFLVSKFFVFRNGTGVRAI